jgi:hypothetical protein
MFCAPKKVFELTGGYDESFEHAYYDDDDFYMNCKKHGFNFKIVSTVGIKHPPYGGTTIGMIPGSWKERNHQKFINKWGVEAPSKPRL